ncbi:hypothetical protein DFJ58DRAFT_640413, partial [Suillus subalutaceus]|uniref:uncharacterized protein n=1 Tax=Suillus subalutaceus TaxID=48586 RepID=UPI001B8673E1
ISAECAREVQELTKVENGLHFSAVHAKAEQIEGFQIDDMALQIAGEAPVLWALLDSLLSARALQVSKIESKGHTEIGILVSDAQEAEDSEYWAQVDDLEGVIEGITGDCISRAERLTSQRSATMMLQKVVIVSLLKKSTNQKANSLSSILGIFLHSTHAPEKVIEMMAKMGLSISVDAIHDTVRSLSAESSHALQYLGQTLLAAYAYNNFDTNNITISEQKSFSN